MISNGHLPSIPDTRDGEDKNLKHETEDYREIGFKKVMAELLDAYTRFSANGALEIKEWLDGAKKALFRQEREKLARFKENVGLDLESDSGNFEPETLFEQQHGVRVQ